MSEKYEHQAHEVRFQIANVTPARWRSSDGNEGHIMAHMTLEIQRSGHWEPIMVDQQTIEVSIIDPVKAEELINEWLRFCRGEISQPMYAISL